MRLLRWPLGCRSKKTKCLLDAWNSVINVQNKKGRNSGTKKSDGERAPRRKQLQRERKWRKIEQGKWKRSKEGPWRKNCR
jgi:hypothetical protein